MNYELKSGAANEGESGQYECHEFNPLRIHNYEL